MMVVFRGEPVEIERIDGNDTDDCYIASAYWTKTGVDLTEAELRVVEAERPDVIAEMWMDMMIVKAEARSDYLDGR